MSNSVIITDAGDEQPGTSIVTPIGLRNKNTVNTGEQPTFDEWAKHIYQQVRKSTK